MPYKPPRPKPAPPQPKPFFYLKPVFFAMCWAGVLGDNRRRLAETYITELRRYTMANTPKE